MMIDALRFADAHGLEESALHWITPLVECDVWRMATAWTASIASVGIFAI